MGVAYISGLPDGKLLARAWAGLTVRVRAGRGAGGRRLRSLSTLLAPNSGLTAHPSEILTCRIPSLVWTTPFSPFTQATLACFLSLPSPGTLAPRVSVHQPVILPALSREFALSFLGLRTRVPLWGLASSNPQPPTSSYLKGFEAPSTVCSVRGY